MKRYLFLAITLATLLTSSCASNTDSNKVADYVQVSEVCKGFLSSYRDQTASVDNYETEVRYELQLLKQRDLNNADPEEVSNVIKLIEELESKVKEIDTKGPETVDFKVFFRMLLNDYCEMQVVD